jgi:hypothetical protein
MRAPHAPARRRRIAETVRLSVFADMGASLLVVFNGLRLLGGGAKAV